MNREVQSLVLKERNAFRSSDHALYSTAHVSLIRGIERPNQTARERLRTTLTATTAGRCGLVYSTSPTAGPVFGAVGGDISRAEELNHFFPRF